MVVLFKVCPRCSGDLLVNSDMHGRYVECLQCGYMGEFPDELATKHQGAKLALDRVAADKGQVETGAGARSEAA